MSGVTVPERDFYKLLLALDGDDDPMVALDRIMRHLLLVTAATEASVDLQSADPHQPAIARSFTADEFNATGLARDRRSRFASSAESPKQCAIDPTGMVLTGNLGTALIGGRLRVERRTGTRTFSARQRELFELLLRVLPRLAERLFCASLPPGSLHEETQRLHRRLVANALERTRGNVSRAAHILGVTRGFVYDHMPATGQRR